jgi:hypothetical protein
MGKDIFLSLFIATYVMAVIFLLKINANGKNQLELVKYIVTLLFIARIIYLTKKFLK